jgi:hypothetical protein
MLHALDGCRAKIERAKELTCKLNGEITELVNGGLYFVDGENQWERRRYVFKLRGPPVPLRIAVVSGEIIHHLRSTFDHVVWALAKKNGLSDEAHTRFPVCRTPEKFNDAVRHGEIKGVSRIYHPLIEALQPYRAADPANSIVQVVHDLDIKDKHRLLVVVTHALVLGNALTITKNDAPAPDFGIELPPTATMRYPWAIEDGIEVHWIPLRGTPNPAFEMKTNATVQIAFEQVGAHERAPVIPILTQLCDGVERAIQSFDICF